ncbi:hypothetical protein ACFQO9_04555 [Chryseobacterium zhengzhouense]|uniref:Uncharacterized protein n=1 Tax=Chryseobacterium zhengzhouense TaxID=1636086 RepID=A0ABW2LXJ1_9FLAO
MKASEFRIGNIIYNKEQKKEHIVTLETLIKISEGKAQAHLSYLEITEDLLKKLGAEKICRDVISLGSNYVWTIMDIILFKDYGTWYLMKEGEWCLERERELKYFHELQNLYFALNEKELNLM